MRSTKASSSWTSALAHHLWPILSQLIPAPHSPGLSVNDVRYLATQLHQRPGPYSTLTSPQLTSLSGAQAEIALTCSAALLPHSVASRRLTPASIACDMGQVHQVARQTNYRAFSYCFPGDHTAEGFLSIGAYPKDELVYTNLIPHFGDRSVYSLQQIDMMVDGNRLQVDQSEYTKRMMVVDSGTVDTFLLGPVFDAFSKAMASAMQAKGFLSDTVGTETCFRPNGGDSVDSGDLPTVEMRFIGTTLKLPPENVFHDLLPSHDKICLAFKPDVAGVRNVQILGNKAT